LLALVNTFSLSFGNKSRAHSSEDVEDEQESALSVAKGKLLSKIVKKNILESIFFTLVPDVLNS
jgi:hypothetical protein